MPPPATLTVVTSVSVRAATYPTNCSIVIGAVASSHAPWPGNPRADTRASARRSALPISSPGPMGGSVARLRPSRSAMDGAFDFSLSPAPLDSPPLDWAHAQRNDATSTVLLCCGKVAANAPVAVRSTNVRCSLAEAALASASARAVSSSTSRVICASLRSAKLLNACSCSCS